MPGIEHLERRLLLAAGDADLSFGTRGSTFTLPIGGSYDAAKDTAVQRDGKILVAGDTAPAGEGGLSVVARFNPDGSVDTSFGDGGRTVIKGFEGTYDAIAIQRDGRIVVVPSDYWHTGVVRLLPDGSPDPTFNAGSQDGAGVRRIEIAPDGWYEVASVLVRRDGRILVAGALQRRYYSPDPAPPKDLLFYQFNADGTPDTSFGEGGRLMIGRAAVSEELGRMRLLDDGGVIGVGSADGDLLYFRVAPDGTVDADFGPAGAAGGLNILYLGGDADRGADVAVLPDGKLLVVAKAGPDPEVLRLTADGGMDATFGTGGRVAIDMGQSAFEPDRLHVLPRRDGKVVVAGKLLPHRGNSVPATLRLNADGSLDRAYGTRGLTQFANAGAPHVSARGSALTPDGGLAMATYAGFGSDLLVVKALRDGGVDRGFGADGRATLDVRGRVAISLLHAIRLRSGKFLGASFYRNNSAAYDANTFALTRWNADGTIDTAFGPFGTRPHSLFPDRRARLFETPEGKILAVTRANEGEILLDRFNADGTRDASFQNQYGTGAILSDSTSMVDAAMDAAGRLIVLDAGQLTRFRANGKLDLAFGTRGHVALSVVGKQVAIDADGRITVAGVLPGTFAAGEGTGYLGGTVALARFGGDGRVDARFGAGRATVPTIQDTHATPTGLAVLPDGRAVVAYVRSWGTDPQGIATFGYVARFGADGALDRSFGAYGEASIPQNDPRAESPLTVDGFDRVLVLGNRWPSLQYGSWDVVITRLTRYGGGDPTFGLLGTADTGFGDGQTGVALLVDSDGGSVVAGSDPARGVFIARFAGDRIYARAEGETLTITGTPAGEVIRARVRGGLIEVDGVGETFAAGQFSRVRVEAWGGDDVVDLAALTLPAIVVAGDGRDVIFGGSAADFLAGGAGDDTLFGGRGADTLRGETGNDYLNGGRGADWVFADAGNDQIFAADATIDTIYGGVGFDRVKADTEDVLQDTEGLLA